MSSYENIHPVLLLLNIFTNCFNVVSVRRDISVFIEVFLLRLFRMRHTRV